MQHPKGIAVVLGVILGLVVVGAVVGGVFLIRGESKTQAPAANANAALQLVCSVDADCVSYCGGDPCYQPICGVTTIGAAGSCTCRSTCGPIAPGGNTNATTNVNTNSTANVNTSTNANTNSTVSTTSWKLYTNTKYGYSIQYPANWILNTNALSSGDLYILTHERQQKLDAQQVVRMMDIGVKVYESTSALPNNSVKKLSFEDWIKQEADSFGFIQRRPITVDGVVGYQGIGSDDGVFYIIFVQKGSRVYKLETGDTKTPTPTEQAMINSFTFTE